MKSIQQQLHRQLLITLLLVLTGTLLLLDYGVRQLSQHYILSRLQHDSDSLLAALDQIDSEWQLPPERLTSAFQPVYSGHYFIIGTPSGRLTSRSLWDLTIDPDFPAIGHSAFGKLDGPNDQLLLWLAVGADVEGHHIGIWVAEDISELQMLLLWFRLAALFLILVTLAALLYWQRRALRSAFASLDPLQQQIRDLRFGETSVDCQQIPEEVKPLIGEIRRLLKQLETRVSRSRNALGNLAHDMKRPLQQLRLLSDQLDSQAAQQQGGALDELQRMVERELRRARIVGVSSPGRQTRLGEDLPPLLDILQRIYPGRRIHADFAADQSLPQDRDDMLELLGNLLDNACKYGRQNVWLQLQRYPQGWQIRVADDGPGIATSDATHLLRRGTRLDESGSGSGLGLAICQDIINSYGGELQLLGRPQGGLMVEIELPDQAADDQ